MMILADSTNHQILLRGRLIDFVDPFDKCILTNMILVGQDENRCIDIHDNLADVMFMSFCDKFIKFMREQSSMEICRYTEEYDAFTILGLPYTRMPLIRFSNYTDPYTCEFYPICNPLTQNLEFTIRLS